MDARSVATDCLLVGVGAVGGALLRFGVSSAIPSRIAPWTAFPWATLLVNLVGAFAIGLLMFPEAGQGTRLLVVVGFLGAFTTLSTYSFETVDLWRSGHMAMALLNVAANGLGGPLLAVLGWKVRGLIPGYA